MKTMKKVLKTILKGVVAFAVLTTPIYWLNLDTKVVKAIEKPLMKHYDEMKRDNRL